jgi:hypothetical protein
MMGSCPDDPGRDNSNLGLYVLAARDVFAKIQNHPNLRVVVSCFEIYGSKLFDLLNSRNPIKCLEDSKQQVQTPGLTEHVAVSVEDLLDMMCTAHNQRSVGSTGANSESSRSHQILHILVKDLSSKKKKGDIERKLSFIDLAGSERGADTVHSSKQTRQEGAEINTSLLALKEVIRSLEKKHGHTPFRGSKLTQVLKDSFVGSRTRTCMLACVSPSQASCENTLNTLRYADRVKENQGNSVETSCPCNELASIGISEQSDQARKEINVEPTLPVVISTLPADPRRRCSSQPSGTLTKRNKDSIIDESAPKALGRPTSGGPVVTRVTEKLKDMKENADHGCNNRDQTLSNTGMLQKVLELLSAHKLSIAEMVEVSFLF